MIFHLQHCFYLIFLKCMMYTANLQWTRGHQCVCLTHTAHLTDLPLHTLHKLKAAACAMR